MRKSALGKQAAHKIGDFECDKKCICRQIRAEDMGATDISRTKPRMREIKVIPPATTFYLKSRQLDAAPVIMR